jgi:hypothetical protein
LRHHFFEEEEGSLPFTGFGAGFHGAGVGLGVGPDGLLFHVGDDFEGLFPLALVGEGGDGDVIAGEAGVDS